MRTVYGESLANAEVLNLRGQAYRVYDGAGVQTAVAYDFKGGLLAAERQLAVDVTETLDWSALGELEDVSDLENAAATLLETEVFRTSSTFDALGRARTQTTPEGTVVRLAYNEAALLESVSANVRGSASETAFVSNVDYDAQGRRSLIAYGNGTQTTYAYDAVTQRLTRMRTTDSSRTFQERRANDVSGATPEGLGSQNEDVNASANVPTQPPSVENPRLKRELRSARVRRGNRAERALAGDAQAASELANDLTVTVLPQMKDSAEALAHGALADDHRWHGLAAELYTEGAVLEGMAAVEAVAIYLSRGGAMAVHSSSQPAKSAMVRALAKTDPGANAAVKGTLAKNLAGVTEIPEGTDLALGLSQSLDEFADARDVVTVFTAWDKGYHQLRVGEIAFFRSEFRDIADTFVGNGGRLKFDLTDLREGVDGFITEWELGQILGSTLELATDFCKDKKLLTGEKLREALEPWR